MCQAVVEVSQNLHKDLQIIFKNVFVFKVKEHFLSWNLQFKPQIIGFKENNLMKPFCS
jgi:hypothetical protein